jgi:hypothetical protein
MNLSLVQLLCFHKFDTVFSSHVWFVMKWKDNRLKWIPANYENVRQVTAFRNMPPGSRPTYSFTSFRYVHLPGHGLLTRSRPSEIYFPGHGLYISYLLFLGPQKTSLGRVLQKAIHVYGLQKRQQGQRLTENHPPMQNSI